MRIVIVGAGFSGTMTAVRLLEGAGETPLEITLVDRTGVMGRGVAYGTSSPAHLLNVPAGRMSPFPEDEDGFLRFARGRDPSVAPGTFVPRRLYGDYIATVLERAIIARPANVRIVRLGEEIVSVQRSTHRASETVRFADGREIEADHVVLAFGNLPAASPLVPGLSDQADSRIVRDPWAKGALDEVGQDAAVLLVGTGLTMMDVVLEFDRRGIRGPLVAVSRRGLLPQPHRSSAHTGPVDARPPGISAPPHSARGMLRQIRSHAARVTREGGDWRDVLASLRSSTPDLWASLPPRERSRFLRHLRPYWDSHRHRAAPAPFETVRSRIVAGSLEILAGRLQTIRPRNDALEVNVALRGTGRVRSLRVERLVQCTGPASGVSETDSPLVTCLLSLGRLCPDPLGIGLVVTETGALTDSAGLASETLSYVGPFLRAREWEATAVPELRVHAARLAARLLRQAAHRHRSWHRKNERPAGDEPLDSRAGRAAR